MRGTGVEIESCLGGLDGLEAAFANPPDLLVLDLGLPDVSGWQVLERLRSEPSTSETPVVVTTGDSRTGVAERVAALDAVLLVKPYSGAALQAEILSMIENRPVAQSLS